MIHPLRHAMYPKVRYMLRKAESAKKGHCPTILERWFRVAQYRAYLSEHRWTEEQIRQYDALAMEDHSNEATPGERRRWEKNWHIVLNKEGKQGPMKQRPDFRESKQAHRQLYKEHAEGTGEGINSIHPAHQARQNYRQQFNDSEEYNYFGSPSNWMEMLSFNKFVFILAMAAARRLEVESKFGFWAIFNLDGTRKKFLVEIKSTGGPVA